MPKAFRLWIPFACCLGVLALVLLWISDTVLRLEASEGRARQEAATEAATRIALWRLEAATNDRLVDIALADESTQARFVRMRLRAGDDGFARPLGPVAPEDLAVAKGGMKAQSKGPPLPSALAARGALADALRKASAPQGGFIAGLDGQLQCNIPGNNAPLVANTADGNASSIQQAADTAGNRSQFGQGTQARQAIDAPAQMAQVQQRSNAYYAEDYRQRNALSTLNAAIQNDDNGDGNLFNRIALRQQAALSKSVAANNPSSANPASSLQPVKDGKPSVDLEAAAEAWTRAGAETLTPYRAAWIGNALCLLRPEPDGAVGCIWLDWPALSAWLLGQCRDLLPSARLVPTPDVTNASASDARLATLPVTLIPGQVPAATRASLSPMTLALAACWGFALLAAAGVAALLWGTARLSERRATFVSAVTHELRTPLTTFQLYTEMLARDMVPDPGRRQLYLETLQKESVRLIHLVENVLGFSRIERGRAPRRLESVTASELAERLRPHLEGRLAEAGMTLATDIPAADAALVLRTDATAVGQVLFNLADNAAKYAARPGSVVELRVSQRGKALAFTFADKGPGLAKSARRKLFQAFSRAAEEAAGDKPGVGLGLAFSRRLARSLGGDLVLDSSTPDGTSFTLLLPMNGGQ